MAIYAVWTPVPCRHAMRAAVCGDILTNCIRVLAAAKPFPHAQSTDSVRFLGIFCALSGCTRLIISIHRNLTVKRFIRVVRGYTWIVSNRGNAYSFHKPHRPPKGRSHKHMHSTLRSMMYSSHTNAHWHITYLSKCAMSCHNLLSLRHTQMKDAHRIFTGIHRHLQNRTFKHMH